jgi:hypothetical protein
VLWLVTASIGDAPIAIIACLALVVGVVLAARGRRGEPVAEPATGPEEPAAPTLSAPPAPATTPARPAAPAVGHGPIRFITHDDEPGVPVAAEPAPAPPEAVAAEPAPAPREPVATEPAPALREPVAAEPEPEPEPERDDQEPPSPPPPPATPQAPPTTFRQGAIKMGGLDRRKY